MIPRSATMKGLVANEECKLEDVDDIEVPSQP